MAVKTGLLSSTIIDGSAEISADTIWLVTALSFTNDTSSVMEIDLIYKKNAGTDRYLYKDVSISQYNSLFLDKNNFIFLSPVDDLISTYNSTGSGYYMMSYIELDSTTIDYLSYSGAPGTSSYDLVTGVAGYHIDIMSIFICNTNTTTSYTYSLYVQPSGGSEYPFILNKTLGACEFSSLDKNFMIELNEGDTLSSVTGSSDVQITVFYIKRAV